MLPGTLQTDDNSLCVKQKIKKSWDSNSENNNNNKTTVWTRDKKFFLMLCFWTFFKDKEQLHRCHPHDTHVTEQRCRTADSAAPWSDSSTVRFSNTTRSCVQTRAFVLFSFTLSVGSSSFFLPPLSYCYLGYLLNSTSQPFVLWQRHCVKSARASGSVRLKLL